MPSPFPGMDPYLEDADFWPDVHATLLPFLREGIRSVLPSGYSAKIDQHVWLQEERDDPELLILGRPDIFVVNGGHPTAAVVPKGSTAPTEQVTLSKLRKRRGTRHIRIVDRRGRRVVTVVELLSPANKDSSSDDHDRYLLKRTEYLATGTNLVEIDLLRVGERMPMGSPRGAPSDYYVLISRSNDFPQADVWGMTVRDPMPVIPVPLKPGHEPVLLDLRRWLDRAYDSADYGDQIDYAQPPTPALRPSDAEWASGLLKKHTRKKK
jgi:hypothetical protein